MSRLAFEEVTRVHGHHAVRALDGVSFAIEAGERVAVTGPSGSGKSTLLHLAGALDHPTRGTVRFDGAEVQPRDVDELRSRRIGFVFQQHHLLAHLTAWENVTIPMVPCQPRAAARRDRALELLDSVGLSGRADHLPSQLSGGEAQRVAIARALANDPGLLLMDEPTGELDSATGRVVLELVEDLNLSRGVTVVVITHDPAVARRFPRILALRDGRLVADRQVDDPLEEDLRDFAGSSLGRLLTDDPGDPRLAALSPPQGLSEWLASRKR